MASSEETQPALNCAEEQEDKMDCKEESNTGLEEKGVAVEGGMEEEDDGKVDASEKDAHGCPEKEKNESGTKPEEAKISESENVAVENTDSKNLEHSQVDIVEKQVESGKVSGEIDGKVVAIPLESDKVSDVRKNENADKDQNEGIGEQIIDEDIKDEAVGIEIEEQVSTAAEKCVVEGKEVDPNKENSQEAEQTVASIGVGKESVCVENEESVSSGTKSEIHVEEDGKIDGDSVAEGPVEVKKDEVVENVEDAVVLEMEDKAIGHAGKETEVQNEEISVKIEEGPTEVKSEEVVREEVVKEEVKEVVVLEMEDLVSGQTGQETKVQSVPSADAAVGDQSGIGNLDEVKLESVVVETENETGMLALTESVDLEIEEGTEVSDLCENPVEGGTEKVTAVTVEYDSVVTEHKDGDVGRETENESSSPAAGVVAVADADEDVVVSETGKKIAVSEIEREMLVIDDGRPGYREVVEEDVTVVEEEVPVVIEYGDDAVVVETTEGVFITDEDKVEDSEAFTIIEHDAVTEVTDEPPVALEEEEIIEEPVMDVIDDTVVITEVQRGGGGGGPPDDEGGIGMKIMGPISGGDQQSGAGSNTSAVIPNSSDSAGACSTKEGCGKGSGEGTGRCGEMDNKGGVGVDARVTGCEMGCEVTLCDNDAKSKPTLVQEDNNQNIIKEQTSCEVDTVNEKVTEKKTGVIMRKKQKAAENENGSTPEVEDDGIGPCARKKFPQLFGKHMTDAYLQQKIDYEIKMRDGTAKLLAASKHPHQMLEAAKNLLTSNSRMIAYMSELQKRKTEEVLKKRRAEDGNQLPCKARVCVSDIRIPLMWRDTDHFKNRGDHRRYAVFCIWKIGTEIYDTTLLKDVDRSMTDITFDDVIVFNDIPHDFVCSVEIYCHKLYEDLTIASTPRRLKKKINEFSTSVGRSVGKRLSGMKDDTEFMANMLVGPKFEKIAEGTLRVSDISDTIATYDLTLFNGNNSDSANIELPLFGNFCCRFAAQPYCLEQETVKGHLELKMTLEDEVIWQRYYCVLKNLAVTCWMSEGDVDENSPPCLTIPITKDCQISHATPGSNKDHQHSFHIAASSRRYNTKSYTLCADTEQQFSAWWDGLQQHMLDQALWQHVCDKKMEISSASPQKLPNFMRRGARPVSLYDATTYKAEKAEDSPMSKILARLHVDDDIPPHSVRKRSEGDDNSRRSIISDTNRSSMCDSKDSRSSTCESKGSRSSTYESKSSSNSESGKISSDDEDSKRSSFRSTASSCSAASGSMASCSEASSTPDTPPPVIKECVRTNSRIETDV